MASRELNILIKAKNLTGGAISGVNKELGGLQSKVSKGFSNAGRNIQRGIVLGATAAGGALVYAVKQAADFEAALNTINTVANVTDRELAGIGDSIRELARTTGTGLDELTTGYYDLVSAGVQASQAQEVLTSANTLAIGGLGTTAETVDLLTTALNSYSIKAEDAGAVSVQFADYFAQAIAAGKVTASELASSFAQVGPLAAVAGIEITELAAGYAQLTAKGFKAAEASTLMRAAIVALQRPTTDMKAIQEKLNVNFLEMAQEKGLAFAYNELAKAADKAGIPMVKLTGRIEGANYAAAVAGKNYESYVANLDKVTHANGVAADQMAKRQQGLTFQWNLLMAQLKDMAITIGSKVIPKLVPLFQKASEFIESHRKEISKFGDEIAKGFENAVRWASAIPWETIGNSLKMAGTFAKTLADAFLSMPSWVQTAVITGWGLNKLTGGALNGIIGSLASGLIRGILNMNAGVVNINAKAVTGGGGGLPGGGPGRIPWGTLLAGGGLMTAAVALVAAGEGAFGGDKERAQGIVYNRNAATSAQLPGAGGRPVPVTVTNLPSSTPAATPSGQFSKANAGGVPVKVMNEALFDHIGDVIDADRDRIRAALKENDIHAARFAQKHLDAMNALRGTVDHRVNDIIPHLGETNRALSMANRNLQDGNARQRETAASIQAARAAIGTGFSATNAQLGALNAKDFSPNVNVNVSNNVQVFSSASQVVHQVVQRTSADTTSGSGFQPYYQG